MQRIEGGRIELHRMSRTEYHDFRRAYVPDPVMDPGPYAYDAQKTDTAYARMVERWDQYMELGIFLKDGMLIGSVAIKRIDRQKKRCELGIVLTTDAHKGQGYGSEAFGLALDYAFDALGMETVYADTMGSNARMQRILEVLGFHCFLRMEDAYDMGGHWEDRLDYCLKKEDRP